MAVVVQVDTVVVLVDTEWAEVQAGMEQTHHMSHNLSVAAVVVGTGLHIVHRYRGLADFPENRGLDCPL